MANNPISMIDPDGRKFVNFDEEGNFVGVEKDNFWHNLWHGTKGRVRNEEGKTLRRFRFADPKHDVEDLENGTITRVHFVDNETIYNMLFEAGAFDEANRDKPGDFLLREGIGGGDFDFSYTAIPSLYIEGVSSDPKTRPSSVLFLVEGMAHNHMNFGNFLYGAGGATLGVHKGALLAGAHKNSRFPSTGDGKRIPHGEANNNGYTPQWDSKDDQRSISVGYYHARRLSYHQMSIIAGKPRIIWE